MNKRINNQTEKPLKVLFVCTGNTCRSPMAQAIAQKLQEENEQLPSIEYRSAGLAAFPGEPISPLAQEALDEMGIGFNAHSTLPLTAEILAQADLVLTMTNEQRNALLEKNNLQTSKTFVLNRYINVEPTDIVDPYGGTIDIYRKTANQLHDSIEKLLNKLKNSLT